MLGREPIVRGVLQRIYCPKPRNRFGCLVRLRSEELQLKPIHNCIFIPLIFLAPLENLWNPTIVLIRVTYVRFLYMKSLMSVCDSSSVLIHSFTALAPPANPRMNGRTLPQFHSFDLPFEVDQSGLIISDFKLIGAATETTNAVVG